LYSDDSIKPMRLRLLLRRLTVSAPHMAVRSALPWPVRWAVLAVMAGLCAAIALWAFEFGKDIAGLDHGIKEQLQQVRLDNEALRAQLAAVTNERDQAQAVANTVDTVMTTEKVTQQKLVSLNKQLESENQRLKDDLGFFEQLLPAAGASDNSGPMTIRGLQAQVLKSGEIKWQVLVIQATKNPVEFNGRLEMTFTGLDNGKPWSGGLAGGAQVFKVRQYGRMEGNYPLPAQVVVRSVTARVLDGQTVRAVHSITL